jgi:hypothetical protein
LDVCWVRSTPDTVTGWIFIVKGDRVIWTTHDDNIMRIISTYS